MPGVRYRTRFGTSLTNESFDTLVRLSNETLVDRSKLINKALDEYFERNGIEIRLNTPEEQKAIDEANKK